METWPTLNFDAPSPAPDYARVMDEMARGLNYATMNGRLDYPSDIDQVIGSLAAMVSKLPQAMDQIRVWLSQQLAAGNLGAYRGWKAHPNAEHAVCAAGPALDAVRANAWELLEALQDVQACVSGLEWTGRPE